MENTQEQQTPPNRGGRVVTVQDPRLDRVDKAVAGLLAARRELVDALRGADDPTIASRNELARRCDGVMSRPTVLSVLRGEQQDGQVADE